MRTSVLAAKTAQEINEIGELLGVDVSREAMPRVPDMAHLQYHRLRAIRRALEDQIMAHEAELVAYEEGEVDVDVDALVDRIERIEGIGPSTVAKIRDALSGESEADEPAE